MRKFLAIALVFIGLQQTMLQAQIFEGVMLGVSITGLIVGFKRNHKGKKAKQKEEQVNAAIRIAEINAASRVEIARLQAETQRQAMVLNYASRQSSTGAARPTYFKVVNATTGLNVQLSFASGEEGNNVYLANLQPCTAWQQASLDLTKPSMEQNACMIRQEISDESLVLSMMQSGIAHAKVYNPADGSTVCADTTIRFSGIQQDAYVFAFTDQQVGLCSNRRISPVPVPQYQMAQNNAPPRAAAPSPTQQYRQGPPAPPNGYYRQPSPYYAQPAPRGYYPPQQPVQQYPRQEQVRYTYGPPQQAPQPAADYNMAQPGPKLLKRYISLASAGKWYKLDGSGTTYSFKECMALPENIPGSPAYVKDVGRTDDRRCLQVPNRGN